LPLILPTQGSEQIEIMFKPSAAGFYIDTLHIRSDTDARRIVQLLVLSGTADTVSEVEIVYGFKLEQNYPNPFNPSTKISWQSPVDSWQTLKIYDVLGNEVETLVDEYKPAGTYELSWYAEGLSSGVYFYQLKVADPESSLEQGFVKTKKMLLIR
jgi:hypothetical protein